jgi:hypothetical protein
MKKLAFITAAIAASITASAVVYEGETYTTKGKAPNSAPYVYPSNVVSVVNRTIDNWIHLYMPSSLSGVNIFNSDRYPSSINDSFNINLGIDNVTGNPLGAKGLSKYSVTIGSSARAEKLHSYVFGSQANALAGNSTAIGYGLSATSDYSTVIGHGKRPSTSGSDYDKNFATDAAMVAWLKTYDENVFPGIHFMNNATKTLYTVTEVSKTPYENGYYYRYIETNSEVKLAIPKGTVLQAGNVFYTNNTAGVAVEVIVPGGMTYTANGTEYFIRGCDYIPGAHDWRYGKSHGPGTFNIVAWHSRWGKTSPGLKAVYVNDDCLEDLVDNQIKTTAPGAMGPQEFSLTAEQIENAYDNPIEINPGSTVTLLPQTNFTAGTELALAPANGGLRNYEVYVPNEPEVRSGLPMSLGMELPDGVRYTIINGIDQAHKLPCKITIKQPYSRFVLAEITEYNDGTDWSPIITKANLKWSGTALVANGTKLLEGTILHSGVSLKYAYPISTGEIVTNGVTKAEYFSKQGIIQGSFYNHVSVIDFTPPEGQNPSPTGGTTVPITIIYETKCGKKPCVFTTELDLVSF